MNHLRYGGKHVITYYSIRLMTQGRVIGYERKHKK